MAASTRAAGPASGGFDDLYGAYLRDPTGNKLCVYCKP